MTTPTSTLTGERADLLEALGKQRYFLRYTTRDLDDEQAALRTTASELSLGGLIKHVTLTEQGWARFMVGGAEAMEHGGEAEPTEWADTFRMVDGETLTGLLDAYEQVARKTDELIATLDLDLSHPLPAAPWFEPGKTWSVRRVTAHLIAEISQHAGHADIIRESLDGSKSMG
ncbi:DinB family protein [Micromonospora sp. NPDC050417]|uniref:DinB family protein n=1 Tax=Micromonospora sp. NPDC050417 TaxID=3364280 RepID=UPI0037B4745E